MELLTGEQHQAIAKALRQVRANQPCPMCQYPRFELLAIYSYQNVGVEIDASVQVPKRLGIPCAVTACERCGLLALHSLHKLGVAPDDRSSEQTQAPSHKR